MSTWNDYRLTCMHGRREGIDSHDCEKCRELTTNDFGPDEPTHLYRIEPKKTKVSDDDN